jgi:thiamine kinase
MRGELLGRGRTAEVYAWDADRALKLFHAWMPDDEIEGEFEATRAARDAGLPVPAAWEFVRDEGRLGIVLERIRGASMLSRLLARPTEVPALLSSMAALQVRLHEAAFPGSIRSQRSRLEWSIDRARALDPGERRIVRSMLDRLPDGAAACHGDLHLDNVILAEGGPVVIDWMCGAAGNPLADLARAPSSPRLTSGATRLSPRSTGPSCGPGTCRFWRPGSARSNPIRPRAGLSSPRPGGS